MTIRHRLTRFLRSRRVSSRGEDGFTIIETSVAMALVFVALVGTLATFGAGVRNVVNGRQRTAAISIARGVIEDARAARHDQVGHDLGDPTLASDSEVSGTPPTYGGEPLVGVSTPVYPQHTWTATNDADTYTVDVYVTWVTSGVETFKRITTVVTWDRKEYDASVIDDHVRMSSFLFDADVPPDPLLDGQVEVDGGTTTASGVFSNVEVSRAVVYKPGATGDLTSLFVREAAGNATSAAATVEMTSGTVSGCESTGPSSAECAGIQAETAADSDTATAMPEHDEHGPIVKDTQSLSSGSVFSVDLGANDSVESESTGRSCFTCFTEQIGDNDKLAHHWSVGTGPDGIDYGFDVGPVDGSLLKMTGKSRSTATLDQDAISDSQLLSTEGRLEAPAVDVLTLNQAPAGFIAAARISAVDVTVNAEAGPTAATPSVEGDAITVDVYDTLTGGTLGYRTMSFEPGEDKEETAGATYSASGATVTMTTTVVSGGKTVNHVTDAGGTIVEAEASLTNWLRVIIDFVITDESTGATLADGTVEFDFGRLSASASYDEGA